MRSRILYFTALLLIAIPVSAQQPRKVLTNRDFPTTWPTGIQTEPGFEGSLVIRTRRSPNQPVVELGEGYFADGNKVRYGDKLTIKRERPSAQLESFDLASFKPLGYGFVKDRTGVYVDKLDSLQVTEHDETSGEDYSVSVYDRVDLVDADTFVVRKTSQGWNLRDQNFRYVTRRYVSDRQGGVMIEGPHRFKIVEAFGPATFDQLSCNLVKVGDRVFLEDEWLRDLDVATLEVLTNKSECRQDIWDIWKDRNGVHFDRGLIKGADPESFRVISYPFAFDKNRRYEYGKPITSQEDQERTEKAFDEAYRKWKARQ